MAHIVVLGAGIGGMPCAYELRQELGKEHQITVVNQREYFQFVPSNPWVAVGWRDRNSVTFDIRPHLERKGINFIAKRCDEIDPEAGRMILADGFTIGGMVKGAGMIHPNLATLLGFLTTDAKVDADFLRRALSKAAAISFNMISVDGDNSTNDMVLLMANGKAGGGTIRKGTRKAAAFQRALNRVCVYLAREVARNGEGAAKLIEVKVCGALNSKDARLAARTIVSSSLLKTAVYGSDPNWGRVLAAAGRSGAALEEGKTIVLTTHQLDVAEQLCERIVIMNNGTLLADSPTKDLLSVVHNEYYEIIVAGKVKDTTILPGMKSTEKEDQTIFTGAILDQAKLYEKLSIIRNLDLPLVSVSRTKNNLEEVFDTLWLFQFHLNLRVEYFL